MATWQLTKHFLYARSGPRWATTSPQCLVGKAEVKLPPTASHLRGDHIGVLTLSEIPEVESPPLNSYEAGSVALCLSCFILSLCPGTLLSLRP